METQCCEQVHNGPYSVSFHRCARKVSVERDGKPYCKIHDPVAVRERRRKSHDKFAKEQKIRVARLTLQEAAPKLPECLRDLLDATMGESMEEIYQSRANAREVIAKATGQL